MKQPLVLLFFLVFLNTDLVQGMNGLVQGSPIHGSLVQGSPIQGGLVQGSPIQGGLVQGSPIHDRIIQDVREETIRRTDRFLNEAPVTVTASVSERSAGSRNDFFSEGDYWWPDPDNPDGPYIRRDGESNPNMFVHDRHAMIRLSDITATLASAWIMTGDRRYADHALEHYRAWFTDPNTLMNPNMLYAQAIHGRVTGRSIGLIDACHLVEPAQSAIVFIEGGAFPVEDAQRIKNWFGRFVTWMTTHDGKSLKLGMDFIVPYIVDKSSWIYGEDIDIWEEWPVRQSSLLFAGLAFGDSEIIDLYLAQKAEPEHPEVIRNLPVRHPVIWLGLHPK